MIAQYKANKKKYVYLTIILHFLFFQENPLPYMESTYKNGTSVTVFQDNSGNDFRRYIFSGKQFYYNLQIQKKSGGILNQFVSAQIFALSCPLDAIGKALHHWLQKESSKYDYSRHPHTTLCSVILGLCFFSKSVISRFS